jgi:hypothetical protein
MKPSNIGKNNLRWSRGALTVKKEITDPDKKTKKNSRFIGSPRLMFSPNPNVLRAKSKLFSPTAVSF